ncbi:hypothetical protein [Dysosmobacter sp. Phy]
MEKIDRTSKNIHKPGKRGLTFPKAFGILTKLSGTSDTERNTGKQKIPKKVLTSHELCGTVFLTRRERRAPCKLNNVTKRKHQTDASFVRDHGRRTKEAEGPG